MHRRQHRVAPNLSASHPISLRQSAGRGSLLSAAREVSEPQPRSARAAAGGPSIEKPASLAAVLAVKAALSKGKAAALLGAHRPTPAWASRHAARSTSAASAGASSGSGGGSGSGAAVPHAWRAALEASDGTLATMDEQQQVS